jgi:hypothetical protein
MTQLIFKIHPAQRDGKSPIEIILGEHKSTAPSTDQLLSRLDRLLKRNKMKIEDLSSKNIKLEISKKAGLTSQRIVKAIIKALSLSL